MKVLPYSFIALVFIFLHLPSFYRARQNAGVDIIKSENVGIYDVKVIKSENTDAILEWLNENNFNFDANDSDVFANYISRDWCFVVAKVQPELEAGKNEISIKGMVAPLVLKFDTEKAIYPTALTAAIGTETEILIYAFSDNKLDCKDRLKLRTAREVYSDKFAPIFWTKGNQEPDELLTNIFETIPSKMFLCKFKDTLTAEQMKLDIIFQNAPDNEPYRETKVVW